MRIICVCFDDQLSTTHYYLSVYSVADLPCARNSFSANLTLAPCDRVSRSTSRSIRHASEIAKGPLKLRSAVPSLISCVSPAFSPMGRRLLRSPLPLSSPMGKSYWLADWRYPRALPQLGNAIHSGNHIECL
jgi:hypothetical protein